MTRPWADAVPDTGESLVGRVDAVLLDIDDTLVDTRAAFAEAIDAVCAAYLPHLAPARRGEVLAVWRADTGGHYRAYTRGETDVDTQRLLRAEQLQEVFGGAPIGPGRYAGWLEVFWSAFQAGWRAHADAAGFVAALDGGGLPFGALTNASLDLQATKLHRSGLARVPLLVGMETIGVGKPDPRVFHEACRLLGSEPGRTLYVGDEADVDAMGAVAAGLLGVWLDRPGARRGGPAAEDPAAVRETGAVVVGSLVELSGLLGL